MLTVGDDLDQEVKLLAQECKNRIDLALARITWHRTAIEQAQKLTEATKDQTLATLQGVRIEWHRRAIEQATVLINAFDQVLRQIDDGSCTDYAQVRSLIKIKV